MSVLKAYIEEEGCYFAAVVGIMGEVLGFQCKQFLLNDLNVGFVG